MNEPLNEEAFIQQYVLARAVVSRATQVTFNSRGSADRGKETYAHIQSITRSKDKQQQ